MQRIATLRSLNKEAAALLHIRQICERCRIEICWADILKAITDIASFGGALHDRQRTEEIRIL